MEPSPMWRTAHVELNLARACVRETWWQCSVSLHLHLQRYRREHTVAAFTHLQLSALALTRSWPFNV